MTPRTPASWLPSLAVLAALIGLWWVASHQDWISRVFLPTPERTFQALSEGLVIGDLAAQTLQTLWRMIEGWLLACIVGILLGALIGIWPPARSWLQPTLEFIRPLPAATIMPLAISVFGLNSSMILFVTAFGAMWPVLLSTLHGFASITPRLREVAAALQLGEGAFVWKVGLPNAMPDILAGMRLSLTVSLIVAVAGEMIASQFGLGQTLLMAARSFRAQELFAAIVMLGLVGLLTSAALAAAEKRILRWQKP